MTKISTEPIGDICRKLQWQRSEVRKPQVQLKFDGLPETGGVYKWIWIGETSWRNAPKNISFPACPSITDCVLDFDLLEPPVILSVGRAVNLHKRIHQHFSNNDNNNRLLQKFRRWFAGKSDNDIRLLVAENVAVWWVSVDDGFERCMLEKYICGKDRPVLDYELEH